MKLVGLTGMSRRLGGVLGGFMLRKLTAAARPSLPLSPDACVGLAVLDARRARSVFSALLLYFAAVGALPERLSASHMLIPNARWRTTPLTAISTPRVPRVVFSSPEKGLVAFRSSWIRLRTSPSWPQRETVPGYWFAGSGSVWKAGWTRGT